MPDIILATVNARYMHAAFGLRYLHANLGDLAPRAAIREFTLDRRALDIVEAIVAERPTIVGLGVYIWNAEVSARIVELLAKVAPDITVVIGGPEVSHELDDQPICARADYVITGEGDLAFARLCQQILDGRRPLNRVIAGGTPDLGALRLPYPLYDDVDVAQRVIYVEASRGCPYRCEFCLSSLDKSVRAFPIDEFLASLQSLFDRGVRRFKFVDRTFNLDIERSRRILEFFAERVMIDGEEAGLFVHFELVPDRLPPQLRDVIARFPPGALQFEIGIQSFDPVVGKLIQRRQNVERTLENLRYLLDETNTHLHTDLIVGLPGEGLEGFARGFDRLVELGVHEIQVGVLKRLRGTPIARHIETHGLVFSEHPPYEILATDAIDFATMNRLKRCALVWDTVANSGNFQTTAAQICSGGASAAAEVQALAEWLHLRFGRVHGIALRRLAVALAEWLTARHGLSAEAASDLLREDFARAGRKDPGPITFEPPSPSTPAPTQRMIGTPSRQARHLRAIDGGE